MKKRFSSRDLTLTALLSAAYVSYSLVSSYTVGQFTHGVDTFVVRSLLFVVLTALTMKAGSSSLMGFISGTTLELTVPTPIHFYVFFGVLSYGLAYDTYMSSRGFIHHVLNVKSVLVATTLSSAIMSIVALSIFTIVGFFPAESIPYVWTFGVLRDVALGVIGGLIGVRVTTRIMKKVEGGT